MNKVGSVRRVFPGGNTYKGFHSFYDYILDQENAKKIIILKGGPGVGKSSFMKKLGESMSQKGFDVEYHHCSSDNNSIDGVVFHEIGVALLDGTSPHTVDPKIPGAIDTIIHLGDFWEEEKLMENKELILRDTKEVSRFFKRAYGYLVSAKGAYDNLRANIDEATDYGKLNMLSNKLINEIFTDHKYSEILGKERHLFGSAITPDGIMDHLETLILPNENIYVIQDKYSCNHSELLIKIGKLAITRGYNVEFFHNYYDYKKIDDIIIKDISTAITTSDKFIDEDNIIFDLDKCLNEAILDNRQDEIKLDTQVFEELIHLAIITIGKAKKLHDKLEEYYIPNMDFETIDLLQENILEKILSYYVSDNKI